MAKKKNKKEIEIVEMPEKKEPKEEIKDVETKLEENKVVVFENFDKVYEPGYYGKELGDRLELALVEALLLLKRGRIKVMKDGKAVSFKELYEHACSLDKRLPERFSLSVSLERWKTG